MYRYDWVCLKCKSSNYNVSGFRNDKEIFIVKGVL